MLNLKIRDKIRNKIRAALMLIPILTLKIKIMKAKVATLDLPN
jgi:FtsZ-binding cell division protein ZapB